MTEAEQRKNCIRLMLAILEPDPRVDFRMKEYAHMYVGKEKDFTTGNQDFAEFASALSQGVVARCNTTCCFLGHGVVYDIGMTGNSVYYNWGEYSYGAYGIDGEEEWDFLFEPKWANDRKQAAARMQVYLKRGAPDFFIYDCGEYPELTSLDIKGWKAQL